MNIATPLVDLVGDARGRLLEEVVRVDRPRSIRKWAEEAGVNHSHAAALLREFEELGLVTSDKVGRSIVVSAQTKSLLRQQLQQILSLRFQIPDAALKAAELVPPEIEMYLFGSAATGRLREGSDIDLCVVGQESDATDDAIQEVVSSLSAAFALPVNVLRFTPREWEQADRDRERVISDIKSSGIRLTERSLP